MKVARVIAISKDPNNSQYPAYGQVRIITILPAITKLYDTVLHEEIQKEIQKTKPLHDY